MTSLTKNSASNDIQRDNHLLYVALYRAIDMIVFIFSENSFALSIYLCLDSLICFFSTVDTKSFSCWIVLLCFVCFFLGGGWGVGGDVFFPPFFRKGEGSCRLTSTRSPPTTFSPLQPRTISSPCIEVSPPISGVPVPGAKAGSSPSMSNDIYTGLSPIISRTSLIRGARDLCQHSSAITT